MSVYKTVCMSVYETVCMSVYEGVSKIELTLNSTQEHEVDLQFLKRFHGYRCESGIPLFLN